MTLAGLERDRLVTAVGRAKAREKEAQAQAVTGGTDAFELARRRRQDVLAAEEALQVFDAVAAEAARQRAAAADAADAERARAAHAEARAGVDRAVERLRTVCQLADKLGAEAAALLADMEPVGEALYWVRDDGARQNLAMTLDRGRIDNLLAGICGSALRQVFEGVDWEFQADGLRGEGGAKAAVDKMADHMRRAVERLGRHIAPDSRAGGEAA